MDRKRLQELAEHIVDVESTVHFWDGSQRQYRCKLSALDSIIEELQDNAEQSADQTERLFLGCLRQKAFKCRVRALSKASKGIAPNVFGSERRRSAAGQGA